MVLGGLRRGADSASNPARYSARRHAGAAASIPSQAQRGRFGKLVAPIALYPDALLATVLPASVYPLEIVQAARFVADTNNLAKLDAQPWDANVKGWGAQNGAIGASRLNAARG